MSFGKLAIAFFVLSLAFVTLSAQNEKKVPVKKVRGEFTLLSNADITAAEAKEKAREDAKRKAIESVCGQKVKSWDVVEYTTAGESYNSLSMIQVEGEVVSFEIITEGVEQSEQRSSELVFYCIADVVVKRGVEPDPRFTVLVEGLKPSYIAGQSIAFSVTPFIDCRMNVFVIDNVGNCARIYPNEAEHSLELKGQTKYDFPTNRLVEYSLFTDLDIETDKLVFVFTKEEIPFQKDFVPKAEVERWMALIRNDEKYIYYYIINILKR